MPRTPITLVDVDTQSDFIEPRGALYVPGAETIVPNLRRLFDHARACGLPVISTADCHAPDDPEFARFPAHCVRDTPGQAKLPLTLLPRRLVVEPHPLGLAWANAFNNYQQIVFLKTNLDAFTNPNLARLVEALGEARFVVFGVATEYCVRLAARGLLDRGARVTLVSDAVRGLAPTATAAAIEELTAHGAEWVATSELVEHSPEAFAAGPCATGAPA